MKIERMTVTRKEGFGEVAITAILEDGDDPEEVFAKAQTFLGAKLRLMGDVHDSENDDYQRQRLEKLKATMIEEQVKAQVEQAKQIKAWQAAQSIADAAVRAWVPTGDETRKDGLASLHTKKRWIDK